MFLELISERTLFLYILQHLPPTKELYERGVFFYLLIIICDFINTDALEGMNQEYDVTFVLLLSYFLFDRSCDIDTLFYYQFCGAAMVFQVAEQRCFSAFISTLFIS